MLCAFPKVRTSPQTLAHFIEDEEIDGTLCTQCVNLAPLKNVPQKPHTVYGVIYRQAPRNTWCRDMSVGGNSHASVKPKSVKYHDWLDASIIVKLLPNLGAYMSRNN